jgi:cell division protein FtsL
MNKGERMDWINVITIVLPVIFTVIIGIFYNNRRIDDINHRIDDLNRRIDDSNHRMDGLHSDIDKRFDETNKKLGDLKEDIREIRAMLMESIRKKAVA